VLAALDEIRGPLPENYHSPLKETFSDGPDFGPGYDGPTPINFGVEMTDTKGQSDRV
jgi:hypothetical protein